MKVSPYSGKYISKWGKITDGLIKKHPLEPSEIVDVVLQSWDDIFNSKLGSFSIGIEIFPTPQIMSFLLHELVAHYLGKKFPKIYKVGKEKSEKDVHCITDTDFSIEIKASSNPTQIFANRSYAQPVTGKGQKNKNGYYITINFEKFKTPKDKPKIILIRFGYIEHSDWKAQASESGQQASLLKDAYLHKLRTIYPKTKLE